MKSMQRLSEVFLFPFKLVPVASIGSVTLYGSKKLNEQVVKAWLKIPKVQASTKEISDLLDKGQIIVCFIQPSYLKFIKYKLFKSLDKNIYGLYMSSVDKIYIILSNTTSIFGRASNIELVGLIVHECVHRFSTKKPDQFISTFERELIRYYSLALSSYFKLDRSKLTEETVLDYVVSLHKLFERAPVQNRLEDEPYEKLEKIITRFFGDLTEISREKFQRRLSVFIEVVRIYNRRPSLLIPNYKFFVVNSGLAPSFRRPYLSRLGFISFRGIVIQELFMPSEVAATYLEYKLDDRVSKVISV